MKTSCRVNQQHIHTSRLCRTYRIIDYAGRICAFVASYHGNVCTSCPFSQLFTRGRTKGICRCNQYFFAFLFQLTGKLSDGCGLSNTVDADNHDDRLLFFKIISGFVNPHLLLDSVNQKLFTFRWLLDVILLHLTFQTFNDFRCRLHTDITHNQNLFQFLIEILINRRKAVEHRIYSPDNCFSCLGQTFLQSGEKAFLLLAHTQSFPSHKTKFLVRQLLINQVNANQSRNTLLLHGDTVKSVNLFHGTSSVCNNNKLGIFCQLM